MATKVSKVFIQNFRSIGPDGLLINFSEPLTALVGRNSTGKSNVLQALNLVLGSSYWSDGLFKLEDFHEKNPANDILIQVFFAEPLKFEKTVDSFFSWKEDVHGFQIGFKQYKRNTANHRKGELNFSHCCLKKNEDPIMEMTKAPRKGQRPVFGGPLKVPYKLRDAANCVLIPISRDVFSQNPSNSKTLLGSLVKGARDNFLLEDTKIEISKNLQEALKLKKREFSQKELFEVFINKANETIKTEELIGITTKINEMLLENLGEKEANGLALDFDVQSISDQYKYLKLSLTRNDLSLPAAQLGSGFQALLVVAIFRACLELKNQSAVFLIEEPETYLHPHAKRQFYKVMQGIGETGGQIIYTTHSGHFVRIGDFQNIRRVILSSGVTDIFPKEPFPQLNFTDAKIRSLELSLSGGRSEFFFSNSVLLVEGATEKFIFEYIFRDILKYEAEKQHISIIEVGGKGELHKYIQLAKALNIPFVSLYDSDILTEEPEDAAGKVKFDQWNRDSKVENDRIENLTNETTRHVYEPYIEVTMGISERLDKKRSTKPERALSELQKINTADELMDNYPELMKPLEKLLGDKFWQVEEEKRPVEREPTAAVIAEEIENKSDDFQEALF